MELNRKQIIKDLQEIVDHYSGSWKRYVVLAKALLLIKELTEDNERLRSELEQRPPKLIITKLRKKENENV